MKLFVVYLDEKFSYSVLIVSFRDAILVRSTIFIAILKKRYYEVMKRIKCKKQKSNQAEISQWCFNNKVTNKGSTET